MDAQQLALAARAAPRHADRPLVLALIPAHNEEDRILDALRSLRGQDAPPDAIVVCADGSTDGTARKAAAMFAHVFETVENEDGRAGALNQALEPLLPELREGDAILVMDAGSILAPAFLSEARRHMDEGAGGLTGVFTSRSTGGLGLLRPDDYALYVRDVTRVAGAVLVHRGAASLFSVAALRRVAQARAQGVLPDGGGTRIYDTKVLTGDDELTLALLYLGYKIFARLPDYE